MFDELKVEERPRWDDRTNYIQGVCREHGHHASLFYTSNQEVDLLLEQILEEKVHLASNATVGAIGILSDNHRLYSALPVLISGQCGRETGKKHAEIIKTTLDGSKKSKLRTICISSDGESRRGEAFVHLTFKHQLSEDSSIYNYLKDLKWMNFEVGDDDITADKDYKHVFKRGRNLALHSRGILLHGIHILPSTIRSHLSENGTSKAHIDAVLKPDDKQDVRLAYDLLREIWALPSMDDSDTSRPSRPGFSDTREAFRTLGSFFFHLLLPYICVELSLSEQLVHLSTAAHILLAMWREDAAGSKLMPTQLYIDIMIMIKNIFFCVAKVKADNPNGKFHIIMLGTDRLEELFGILRTMVGTDASLDIMQLLLRMGGTAEVSMILAKHPEWDRSPRRLKLPALSKNGLDIHKGVDHIKPASWVGDVSVAKVNLRTCWIEGRNGVKKIPRLEKVLQQLEDLNDPEINILQPFGKDIIRAGRDSDDYDDTAEDFDDGLSTSDSQSVIRPLETAVEEAALEEQPPTHQPIFELDGQKVWKGRYLNERFKELKNPGSRDRLKRYANIPRYALKLTSTESRHVLDDSDSDKLTIKIDHPISSLLKCEGRLFVCVGEVNDIISDSKHVNQIHVDRLLEPTSFIGFQLLDLVPATLEDDPSLKHDWRWSFQRGSSYRVPGRLVEPIDPGISLKELGKPFYLFESSTLRTIGAVLLERITCDDAPHVPVVHDQRSLRFPYRESNGSLNFISLNFGYWDSY